jgi:hypothetical protein
VFKVTVHSYQLFDGEWYCFQATYAGRNYYSRGLQPDGLPTQIEEYICPNDVAAMEILAATGLLPPTD